MKLAVSLLSGLSGATALTVLHETLRARQSQAPRMDQLGKQALVKFLPRINGHLAPSSSTLHQTALVGDILSNTLYYSLIPTASRRKLWWRSVGLGILAGWGALVLPKPLGLDPRASQRTRQTKLLTLALYLSGALVTGLVATLFTHRSHA